MVTCAMRFHNSVSARKIALREVVLFPRLHWTPPMEALPAETDFVVIGAGVAGLRAAIELAPAGRVLVLEKQEAGKSAPVTALSDEDEVILHLQDTLSAGERAQPSPQFARARRFDWTRDPARSFHQGRVAETSFYLAVCLFDQPANGRRAHHGSFPHR